MATRVIQSITLAPGPFFFYPWKPVFNALVGDSYEVGYKFFRIGHRSPVNIGLHVVALFIQVLGNWGLLRCIDQGLLQNAQPIADVPILSAVSAASWAAYLLISPAPLVVSALSSAVIAGAYLVAHRIPREAFNLGAPAAFAAVLLFSNYFLTKKTSKQRVGLKGVVKALAIMAVWTFGWRALEGSAYSGAFAQHAATVRLGICGYLLAIAAIRNPVRPLVVTGVLLCRAASILIGGDSEAGTFLYYLSYAFGGSLFQGVAHSVTKEEATLLAHEGHNDDDEKTLRFELSHVTFFPNLLLHAIYDGLRGKE